MIKVGDWAVVLGLSSYKDFKEGEVVSIRGKLADVRVDEEVNTWNVNIKYLRKIKKEIRREELIDITLDLRDKEWFMELTSND